MKRSLILVSALIFAIALVVSISIRANRNDRDDMVKMEMVSIEPAETQPVEPEPTPEIKEDDVADSDIETETEIMYYTENEVVMMAKVLYRECRGIPSDTEKACVVWSVCNRVDSDRFNGDTITEVVTAPNQFAYSYDTPVWDELYELALDVLTRWNSERNGEVSVGRVLPKDYAFYTGDGVHNYFRNKYKGSYSIWDYSLPSPYES